jgi:hypothetical protein
MRRLRSVASLLVLLASTSAVAAPHTAALVPLVKPPAAPELRDRFHEAVTRGLQAGGEEVLGAAEVRLRLGASEEMLACSGPGACVARIAQNLHIDRAVASEIDANGKDYVIKLRLLDAVGRELAKVDEPCDICTVKEADDAVARAATKLAAAAKALPAETAPPATVETPPPPKVETPPPAPKVETPPPVVAAPTPEPAPVTPQREQQKMFPWRAVAITSLVVGVVGIAIGAPLVAIDGNPTCNLPNPRTACSDVYNTIGGGAAMLTFGIAGVAASGVLFYFDHRARKRAAAASVAVTPLVGGAQLTAGGRF